MKRMGFSRKKDCGGAGTRRMAKGRLEGDGRPLARCSLCGVLKDEMGTNTSLSAVYGWSRKGERAHRLVPRNLKARTPPCLPA
jgi:hypothetical protein